MVLDLLIDVESGQIVVVDDPDPLPLANTLIAAKSESIWL